MRRGKVKSFMKDLPILTFGMFLGSLAVHFFLIPSKLIIGSITELSIVINKYFHVDLGTSVSITGGIICCTAIFAYDIKTVNHRLNRNLS